MSFYEATKARAVEKGSDPWEAIRMARYFLHTWFLGSNENASQDETGEGTELALEAMAYLQAACEAHYPAGEVPPICGGCSPIEPFEPKLVSEHPGGLVAPHGEARTDPEKHPGFGPLEGVGGL